MQTNKTYIYPYKNGSASAKALAEALGVKQIKTVGSKFNPNGKTIINWGSGSMSNHYLAAANSVLNPSDVVAQITNKLKFFETVDDNLVVPWTTDREFVNDWLGEGKKVVVRHKLTGHSGDGIEILEGNVHIPHAPLYTQYVPKKDEFRIHVAKKGDDAFVFDIQQKKRKNDVADDDVDWKIRNLAGGFIYARENIIVPQCVEDVALEVFKETGLDFGAVDIIFNEHQNRAYALEVNTAPGLTGTTLDKYVSMFKELLDG